jgi:recombination protein RecT
MLGKKASGFLSSVINTVNNDKFLSKCDGHSVMMSAAVAAALDLPVDKNLGFAWIIPYGNKASFQLGFKGYVQLAQRSGKYKTINTGIVYEGQFLERNGLTGELKFDWNAKTSDTIVGYTAFFELLNGFEKAIFWTKEEVEAHAMRYSQAYKAGRDTPWKSDFDLMAQKTLLKNILSRWGILSIEMEKAVKYDQGVISDIDTEKVDFPDNVEDVDGEVIDDFTKGEDPVISFDKPKK